MSPTIRADLAYFSKGSMNKNVKLHFISSIFGKRLHYHIFDKYAAYNNVINNS